MFCRKCGNEINDDALFCNKCGEKVSASADLPKAEPASAVMTDAPIRSGGAAVKKGINKKIIIGGAIGVVIAVTAVVLFAVLNKTSSDKVTNNEILGKTDGDIIADAFENTFNANSYKCTLTSYPLDDDGIDSKGADEPEVINLEAVRDKQLFYCKCDNDDTYTYVKGKWFKSDDDLNFKLTSWNVDYTKINKHIDNDNLYAILATNDLEENTGFIKTVMPADVMPELNQILSEYLKKGSKVDCIEDYKKDGNNYSFKVNYDRLIKTLDLDYNKKIKKNVRTTLREVEDEDDLNKITFSTDVDFTIEKEYIKTLDIEMIAYMKGGDLYTKLGKWTFNFEDVNKLSANDCKASKIQTVDNDDNVQLHPEEYFKRANETAKKYYDIVRLDIENKVKNGEKIDDDDYREEVEENGKRGRLYVKITTTNDEYKIKVQYTEHTGAIVGQYPDPPSSVEESKEITFGE